MNKHFTPVVGLDMRLHEREYFVSRIRTGTYKINYEGSPITLYTPTLEDEFRAKEAYCEAYMEAEVDGVKTQDQMLEYLNSIGHWTAEDDAKEAGFLKDLERLRLEIYNNRFKTKMREDIRTWIRKGEKQYLEHMSKKMLYQENTCEGVALMEQVLCQLNHCAFYNNRPVYNYQHINVRRIWLDYCEQMLSDDAIRQIARQEPWRSSWLLRDAAGITLFGNKRDRQLSADQKNLLIWSRTYDNIHESPECPPEDIINDNDMLDGWFIDQKHKREAERAKAEAEAKVGDSSANEVFVMVDNAEDAKRVDRMNDFGTNMIKKERFQVMKQKGAAQQHDFPDEKLKIMQAAHQGFKDKFKR